MFLLQAVNENNVERVSELLADKRTNVNVTDNHNFSGKFYSNFVYLCDFNFAQSIWINQHFIMRWLRKIFKSA